VPRTSIPRVRRNRSLFTESGVPTTFLLASFYWDNFYCSHRGLREHDDPYSLTFPIGDAKLRSWLRRHRGRLRDFHKGTEYQSNTFASAGEHIAALAWRRSLEADGRHREVPRRVPDVYSLLRFPARESSATCFSNYHTSNGGSGARRPVDKGRENSRGRRQDFSQAEPAQGSGG